MKQADAVCSRMQPTPSPVASSVVSSVALLSSPETTADAEQVKRTQKLCEFNKQLTELVSMKNQLPESMQGPLNTCIEKVTGDVREMICQNVAELGV